MSQSIRDLKFAYSPLLMKPVPINATPPPGLWPKKTAMFIMREWRHPNVKTCHAKRQLRLAVRDGEPAIFLQFQNCLEPMAIIAMCLMSLATFLSTGKWKKRNGIAIPSCFYLFPPALHEYCNTDVIFRSVVCGLWLWPLLPYNTDRLIMLANKAFDHMLSFSSLSLCCSSTIIHYIDL